MWNMIINVMKKVFDIFRLFLGDIRLLCSKGGYKHDKKRVVFLSQMPNLWSNYQDLYNILLENEDYDVFILMIPEFDYNKGNFDISTLDDTIYSFHKTINSINVIKAFDNDDWFSLESLEPDITFYERPYTGYLPDLYKINNVCKYSKTCYISYGYDLMDNLFDTSLNVNFFRYLHVFFAENEITLHYNKKRTPISHAFGIRRTVLTGHPILKSVYDAKNLDNIFWNSNDKRFKIMWAPRWTVDKKLGGSNFFNYKDYLVDYTKISSNRSLLFRPHPLLFDNFVSKGLMALEEKEQYLDKFDNIQLFYDRSPEYFTSFWNSDVLVCDNSSIIVCYFITGKPLIYCHTGIKEKNKIMKKIIEVSYNAYNFDDVKNYLDDIERGIDPLKEKRLQVMLELFPDKYVKDVTKNIVKILDEI